MGALGTILNAIDHYFDKLVDEAGRYMALNNTVVLSISCWGRRATMWALGAAGAVLAVAVAVRAARR